MVWALDNWWGFWVPVSYSHRKIHNNKGDTSHRERPPALVFPTGKYGIENSNKGDCGCHLISPKHFSPSRSYINTPNSTASREGTLWATGRPLAPAKANWWYREFNGNWLVICLWEKEDPGLETGALVSFSQGSWERLAFQVHVSGLVFLCHHTESSWTIPRGMALSMGLQNAL